MYPSRLLPQLKIRFSSHELKDWIDEQAKINHRTLSSEIKYHLEQAMLKNKKELNNGDK
jgi:hypothetical protein